MVSTLLGGSNAGLGNSWWIILILVGVLVIMYLFSFFKRKKFNQETVAMLDSLKPGDKIKTYSGIYGTVVSIRETTDGKVVTIETGDGNHKSYTSIDANAIYCLDKKEDIVYDKDGNIVEPKSDEEKPSKNENDASEGTTEINSDLEQYEIENEEEPTKKRRSKKSQN